jgi:hypothetical protein
LKFFLGYFARFSPKLVETKTNSRNAKPIHFTGRTADKIALFLWSIPSCFLLNFVFLKRYGFVYSFEFWFKSRDEAGGGTQKEQLGSVTDHSVLLHFKNARALANQIACYKTYIPLIL